MWGDEMKSFSSLIPQNTAIKDARRIAIYNEQGNRVGQIPLGTLTPPNPAKKLYSFGALSDVHYQYETAAEDFRQALTYLNDREDVAFTCICGDLTSGGTAAELAEYSDAVAEYSPNTPVYAMCGNHDVRSGLMDSMQQYTGKPNYFSIDHGDDVFIFVGNVADWTTAVISNAELQWLYETLEANRNKRCFLFEHIRPTNGCGNALGLYVREGITDWGGTTGAVFESLLSHYHNVIFFHGHSHLKLELQAKDRQANYDNIRGCHSVHIPSLAAPREDVTGDGVAEQVYSATEGYVVDVYKDGVHLRGRDFAYNDYEGRWLPIASYWLDTTLQTIPAGTYTDPNGIITTT